MEVLLESDRELAEPARLEDWVVDTEVELSRPARRAALLAGVRSSRRSICAFKATTTVDNDIRIAPT
ncbi:hypothetical protein PCS76_21535, partial [Acinetobacter baumannii]|nr:hypothetical protein [Acinetobacter baumannii]